MCLLNAGGNTYEKRSKYHLWNAWTIGSDRGSTVLKAVIYTYKKTFGKEGEALAFLFLA